MSDILNRLRNRIHDSPIPAERLMDESADEIESLVKAIAGLRAELAIAKAALEKIAAGVVESPAQREGT